MVFAVLQSVARDSNMLALCMPKTMHSVLAMLPIIVIRTQAVRATYNTCPEAVCC